MMSSQRKSGGGARGASGSSKRKSAASSGLARADAGHGLQEEMARYDVGGSAQDGMDSVQDAMTTPTIDFDKLDIAALKRYKGHYNLRVKHNATKSELAAAIARHFENHAVEELETITYFLYTVRNNERMVKGKDAKRS